MYWTAPFEKGVATCSLEKRLWDAYDQLRTNSGLKAQEYPRPNHALIFWHFAEARFVIQRLKLEYIKAAASTKRSPALM